MKFSLVITILLLFVIRFSVSETSDLVKNILDGVKETYEKQGIDGVIQYLSNDFKLKGNRKVDKGVHPSSKNSSSAEHNFSTRNLFVDFAVKQLKHRANSSSLPISSITNLAKYVSSARIEKDLTLVINTKNGYTLYARPNPLVRGGYSFYQAAKTTNKH